MLQAPNPRAMGVDLATRRQIALDRIQQLIASRVERAARAWRNQTRSGDFGADGAKTATAS